MEHSPIRNMLLLSILLFVILSSGSLQCALNCYDNAVEYSANAVQVTDCHPLALEELTTNPLSSFCHHSRSSDQARTEPVLLSMNGGQVLALINFKSDIPAYRSAEPFSQPLVVLNSDKQPTAEILPLSQNLKQLRSTILLM